MPPRRKTLTMRSRGVVSVGARKARLRTRPPPMAQMPAEQPIMKSRRVRSVMGLPCLHPRPLGEGRGEGYFSKKYGELKISAASPRSRELRVLIGSGVSGLVPCAMKVTNAVR